MNENLLVTPDVSGSLIYIKVKLPNNCEFLISLINTLTSLGN